MTVTVTADTDRKVGEIRWSRTEKNNALTAEMVLQICDGMTELEANDDLVAIVLAGDGDDLTIGFDAAEEFEIYSTLPPGEPARIPPQRSRLRTHSVLWWGPTGLFTRVVTSPKATILRAQGRSFGAGTYLATCCDVVVAADDVQFGHPQWSVVGVSGDVGLLTECVGLKRAKEIAFAGKIVRGNEAAEWGLADAVVPRAQLDEATREYSDSIGTLMRDGITAGTFTRVATLQKMSLGSSFAVATQMGAVASNIHHREGEFNFLRERRENGVEAAVAAAERHFAPSNAS